MFIDDSDFECALVASVLPEVQVEKFPADPLAVFGFIEGLRNTEVLHVTQDDLKRGASYKAAVKTERLRKQSTDLGVFLRNLQITLTIKKQDRNAVQRISQLTQRTNQFNLTTRRYAVEDVARFFETGWTYTMSMQDRFSDHGTIAVAIVAPQAGTAVEIDTFLMSCRAFGRGVENAFLKTVLSDLRNQGVGLVRATYQRTARNGMVRDFYLDNGFVLIEESGDARVFEYALRAAPEGLDGAPYTVVRAGF
jgi:FkbH-like protein